MSDRQQRRALERALKKAERKEGRQASYVEKDGERYMRIKIESTLKGFRVRQVGTDNFLRSPNGRITYFPSPEAAQVALEALKKAGEKQRRKDRGEPDDEPEVRVCEFIDPATQQRCALFEEVHGPGRFPDAQHEYQFNPCKCVDCGGDQPNHSADCTYMLELHGEKQEAAQ